MMMQPINDKTELTGFQEYKVLCVHIHHITSGDMDVLRERAFSFEDEMVTETEYSFYVRLHTESHYYHLNTSIEYSDQLNDILRWALAHDYGMVELSTIGPRVPQLAIFSTQPGGADNAVN